MKTIASLLRRKTLSPYCNENTFFVWEPCSHSHAEVVPGYCKLLLDAGFEVSVLIEPKRIDEGLFSNFEHDKLHINRLSQRATRRFFNNTGLASSLGILVTTAGKLAPNANYEVARAKFGPLRKNQKILLVEHDIKDGVDRNTLTKDIITLRRIDYRNAITTPINPHYFGKIKEHRKSKKTIFASVGAISNKRRNAELLIDAVESLFRKQVENFEVVVIGKNNLGRIPKHLRHYFQSLGRLSFKELYQHIQDCDFLLPLLDPQNPAHRRYITTGTSGTFQLSLGFKKPVILEKTFAEINRLNSSNSVLYESNSNFDLAMEKAIAMNPEEYDLMSEAMGETSRLFHSESIKNLRSLL